MGPLERVAVVLRQLRSLSSRARLERELREEMEAHVALRRDALVREGADPAAAGIEARRMFGNATLLREEARTMWGFPTAESVLQDVRYGLRSLLRTPVFLAVAVLSIGGGLAAGTTLFALMNAVIYRPLGVGDARDLYRVFTGAHSGELYSSSSYPDYLDFRAATGVLAATCATERVRANVVVSGAAALHHGEIVSPGCFDALRLPPAIGRYFSEGDAMALDVPPPVVISHALWLRRFDGEAATIGQTVLLNGRAVVIVGVASRGFAGTSLDGGAEFWAPVQLAPVLLPPDVLDQRRQRMFTVFARLSEGVEREQAEAALAVVAARLQVLDPAAWTTETGSARRVTVMRETEARFAGAPRSELGIIAGAIAAIGVIVAIACLNLATMFLARGAARTRELSIRLAVGASRSRVIRLLATESLIVAALGVAAALIAVLVGVRLFHAYRPAEVPAFDLALDWRVVIFATGLAVAAALLVGLVPALHTIRLAISEGLSGGLVGTRVRRARTNSVGPHEALIVTQVAVSIALLLVATLFVRARAETTLSPGFEVAGVAVVPAHLEVIADSQLTEVTDRLLAAAAAVPTTERVSLGGVIPMTGETWEFAVTTEDGLARNFLGNVISPGYFSTMGIGLRLGRDFDQRDGPGGAPVAIVSATLARSVWGATPAIGRSLTIAARRFEVVGVVADTRYRALTEPFQNVIYLPIRQVPQQRFNIHARTRDDPAALAALEDAVRVIDPRVAVGGASTLRSRIEAAMAPERAAQWIGAVVGIIQLGLAVMALWGLVTYAVERRTREMGIRLALGASPSGLVRLTMRPAALCIAVGVAIGCLLGSAVARVIQSASVALAPLDLRAMIPVAGAFTFVAMLAAWWPARRVARAQPAASLRRE